MDKAGCVVELLDYKRRRVGNKPYIKGTGRVVTLTIVPALVISTSNMDMIMKERHLKNRNEET